MLSADIRSMYEKVKVSLNEKLKKIPGAVKKFAPSLMMLLAAANSAKADVKNSSAVNNDTKIETVSETAESGVYHGIRVNYADVKAEDVGHIWESGLNPMAKSKSGYFGLYQYSPQLFKQLKDYLIKKGFTNLRNNAGNKAWKKYSTGKDKERFEAAQFEFMYDRYYKDKFDALTKECGAPVITVKNYNNRRNKVYSAAVISITGQNPSKTVEIMKTAYSRTCKKEDVNSRDFWDKVGVASNDVCSETWKSMKKRYKAQKELMEKMMCKNREAQEISPGTVPSDSAERVREMIRKRNADKSENSSRLTYRFFDYSGEQIADAPVIKDAGTKVSAVKTGGNTGYLTDEDKRQMIKNKNRQRE